jgi:hypothetical protein
MLLKAGEVFWFVCHNGDKNDKQINVILDCSAL